MSATSEFLKTYGILFNEIDGNSTEESAISGAVKRSNFIRMR